MLLTTPSAKVSKTVRLARVAVFTALAVAGSFIPIPSPVSSVALDSASGYFSALYFGEVEGAYVLFAGHLATATVHGFPLGILHITIALGLALQGWIMGKSVKRIGGLPATVIGVSINTVLTFVVVPFLGIGAAIALIPYLLVASSINGGLAYAAYRSIIKIGLIRHRT